jgi:hypothetical protein
MARGADFEGARRVAGDMVAYRGGGMKPIVIEDTCDSSSISWGMRRG